MYTIRIAIPEDEVRINELFQEMLRSIYHTEDADGYKEGELDRFWSGNENRIFVAEDREVMAFLSVEVHHEQGDYVYLDDFSVTEEYRNRGIGSRLLNAAESYAKEINIYEVLLHVEKANELAMSLYERSGYMRYRDDGTRFLMKKNLLPY